MRDTWNLAADSCLSLGGWEMQDALIDFQGPQLISVLRGGKLHVAVASDEDLGAEFERWISARITSTELTALKERVVSIGEIFRSKELNIVDIDPARFMPIREWRVSPGSLHQDDLPGKQAFLSESLISEAMEAKPEIIFDRENGVSLAMRFEALADILKDFQRLWNALSQAVCGSTTARGVLKQELSQRASLSAGALAPGSVRIEVHPGDMTLFDEVSRTYAELVAARDDEDILAPMLQELQVRVRSTYRDLLGSLEKHDTQMYLRSNTSKAFLSPYAATLIRPKLEQVEELQVETQTVYGCFLGLNIRLGSFEFRDVIDNEIYQGTVDADLRGEGIVIGDRCLYEAVLSVTILSDSLGGPAERYKLVNVSQVKDVEINDKLS
jgi:hypothetical protein